MKARQDFVLYTDKAGVLVPYKSGDDTKNIKEIKVKVGQEIPTKYIKIIVERNIDYVDVKYVNKVPVLPKEFGIEVPKVPKELKIKKRQYSQESLTQIYNDKGFSALRAIGEKFGVKDRSSKGLITEILRAQEEKQRNGL